MILILSFDSYEQGTDPVIDWLLYYKADFVKVSLSDLVSSRHPYCVDVEHQDIYLDGISVKESIHVVWNRRFMGELGKYTFTSDPFSSQLTSEVQTEIRDLTDYLADSLKDKKWLLPFSKTKANKLSVLQQAHAVGLTVPRSQLINNKADLKQFYASSPHGIISKPISDSRKTYLYQGDTYLSLTNSMDSERIEDLPDFFFPTLFQEKVQTEFEIRIFYLDGNLFPTACLPATATQSVDKKMDIGTLHMVPYQLPFAVESSIRKFMQSMDMNTGCLDFIKDCHDTFVFIEVNPAGQYLAESEKCNYKLDKAIAQWLITQDRP